MTRKAESGLDAVIEPFGDIVEYQRENRPVRSHGENSRAYTSQTGSPDAFPAIMQQTHGRPNGQDESHVDELMPRYERGFEKGRRRPNATSSGLTSTHDVPARPAVPTPTGPLVHEVAELRRKVERMRAERQARDGLSSASELTTDIQPPPSYDEWEV